MKSRRIGMGKGKGKGYHNIRASDKLVHQRAGRGQKTYSSMSASRMNRFKDTDRDGVPDHKDCRPKDPKRQDFGLTDAQQKVIEKELGSKITKNYDGDQRGNIVELENGEEWLIFDSYEDAESKCVEYVKEQLDEEPELFTQNWLENFIFIGDTDRRIIAGEESDDYVDNVLEEPDDLMAEAEEYKDEYEELQEQIDEKESKETELITSDHDVEAEETRKVIDKLEEKKEKVIDEARESLRSDKYDEIYKELEDPFQYFVEDRGIYSREDLLKQSFISIDTDKASQDAVDTDGVAHFFASYDGDQKEFSDNSVGYRTN